MVTKQAITHHMRLKAQLRLNHFKAVTRSMLLRGEPLLYSLKQPEGYEKDRFALKNLKKLRLKQFFGAIRSTFMAELDQKTPVVFIIKLFVSPHPCVPVDHKDVISEKTPAVGTYELCEYLLSFLELMRDTLYSSHRQICAIEIEKHYSLKPRIEFQYMRYPSYVELKNDHRRYTQAKMLSKLREKWLVQQKRIWDGLVAKESGGSITSGMAAVYGPFNPYNTSPFPSTTDANQKKNRKAPSLPACEKT